MTKKLTVQKLLQKRDNDFDKTTEKILEQVQPNLIPALVKYFKTERIISVHGIITHEINPNFVMLFLSLGIEVGDNIQLVTGENIQVTDENILDLVQPVRLMVPNSILDKSPDEILESLTWVDDFIRAFSLEDFFNCVDEGAESLEAMTKMPNIITKAEQKLLKPNSVIEFNFDSLSKEQKDQMKLFQHSKTIN